MRSAWRRQRRRPVEREVGDLAVKTHETRGQQPGLMVVNPKKSPENPVRKGVQ